MQDVAQRRQLRHRCRHPQPGAPGEDTQPDGDSGTTQVPELKFRLKSLRGARSLQGQVQRLVQTPVRCLRARHSWHPTARRCGWARPAPSTLPTSRALPLSHPPTSTTLPWKKQPCVVLAPSKAGWHTRVPPSWPHALVTHEGHVCSGS